MKKVLSFSICFLLLIPFFSNFLSKAHAATIRSNDTIIISNDEKNLSDLYLFGGTIEVNAPVANDVVAAGGNITLNNNVRGGILAVGGMLRLKGTSGGSVRAAGGNIIIDGNVARDLVVAGGSVTITKSATIGGDLIILGGELNIDGTVNGKTVINGAEVRINGRVNKQVEGNVGMLTIGRNAVVGGDIVYSSQQKASIEEGAQMKGQQRFTKIDRPEKISGLLTAFSFYKLIIDIILSLALIYFLAGLLKPVLKNVVNSPAQNALYGAAFLVLVPIASVFFLVLFWLGAASFLFYFLVVIISVFVTKVLIGWFILRLLYRRDKREYILDWKAGFLGPIVLFLVALIPFLGWLFLAILYLISTGAVIRGLTAFAGAQKLTADKK